MLCAAGKVRRCLRLRLAGCDSGGTLLPPARESGSIEAHELDEGMLQWGLRAAGMRVPFLPTRVGLATDVMKVNPDFRTVQSPYADGEVLLAMPALHLDAALIHVDRADRLGNVQTDRPRSLLRRAVRARRGAHLRHLRRAVRAAGSRAQRRCALQHRRAHLRHRRGARRAVAHTRRRTPRPTAGTWST